MHASARLPSVVVIAAAALLLAGCSVSANLTQSPDRIAETAEDALEEQVGSRPDVDCGDEQVDLVEGETVDCVLTDPSTGTSFDAVVTITEVDGSDYSVGVEVGTEPVEG